MAEQSPPPSPQSPAPEGGGPAGGMMMPPVPGVVGTNSMETTAAGVADTPRPAGVGSPGFGRQMAQLIVIPAVIALGCVVVALLFAYLTGRPDTVETQLLQLRQTSGLGRLPMGLQDPRYKDRGRAAASLAQSIRTLDDPDKRADISAQLADILSHDVGEQESTLRAYLLLALAQLGQPEALGLIVEHLDDPQPTAAIAAVRALLEYPDREAARSAIGPLRRAAGRSDANLRALVAAALGAMAVADDEQTKVVLREMMTSTGAADREARWNAAAALARLGDEQGTRVMAHLLLSREALARLGGPGDPSAISKPGQTRIILASLGTLAIATDVIDPQVWASVRLLASDDPDITVRKQARQLLDGRSTADGPDGEEHRPGEKGPE